MTRLYPFLDQTMALIRAFERAERRSDGRLPRRADHSPWAYGGEVYRMDRFEAGFMDSTTPAARKRPGLSGHGDARSGL